jgi:hypothetical protein
MPEPRELAMQPEAAERERLTRNVQHDRSLRRHIRRRRVPWALTALGLAAFLLLRRRQRQRR